MIGIGFLCLGNDYQSLLRQKLYTDIVILVEILGGI